MLVKQFILVVLFLSLGRCFQLKVFIHYRHLILVIIFASLFLYNSNALYSHGSILAFYIEVIAEER